MAITRWSLWLFVCLALVGCSSLTISNKPAAEEAELFAQGLDQYLATGQLTTLTLLPKQYPQGEWRTRAEGIIDMAKQKLHQDTQTQHDNQGLTQCLAEKDLLAKDNKILEVTLERLKQVLIDSELRAN
jgi:hypothetical protein